MREDEIRDRALLLMEQLSESFGEMTEESQEELTAILDGLEKPMSYLFFMQKHCESQAAECKELADIYAIRRKSWEAKRSEYKRRMQDLLLAMDALGEEAKVKAQWGTAFLGSSSRAVIVDADKLDERFLKVTKSVKSREILQALRAGEPVEGAELETSKNLSIRSK